MFKLISSSIAAVSLSLCSMNTSHAANINGFNSYDFKVKKNAINSFNRTASADESFASYKRTKLPVNSLSSIDENATEQEDTVETEATPEVKAPPQGIFHSAGFIQSSEQRFTLVNSEINGQEYVDGTLVRVGWKTINPAEGQFDFTAIERELDAATEFNASINLAVLDSLEIPQYIIDKCESFSYTFRGSRAERTCLPWDAEYQKYKKELVSKLGEQFDSHPNLASIYFTYAAMTNGIEMHWRVDEAAYASAGYTPELLAQSYNDVLDMYADAFKTTSVIMEIHEVFRESFLAESAFEYCFDKLGARCGVAIWWCSSRMATDPKQSEFKVYPVAQQATKLSFAVCQTIGSFTSSPNRFDQGQGWSSEDALRNELSFFIGEGFTNFELWTNDIKNAELISIIKDEIHPNL